MGPRALGEMVNYATINGLHVVQPSCKNCCTLIYNCLNKTVRQKSNYIYYYLLLYIVLSQPKQIYLSRIKTWHLVEENIHKLTLSPTAQGPIRPRRRQNIGAG
jgi:hypothetical protein